MEQKNFEAINARVVVPEKRSDKYSRILGGFPDSVFMKSGLVSLKPGDEVGIHSTEANEELLIILSGNGIFRLGSGEDLAVEEGGFLYCPPGTVHNVLNTSDRELKYVYVVSKADYS